MNGNGDLKSNQGWGTMVRTAKIGLCLAVAGTMVLTSGFVQPSFAQQDASDLNLSTWTKGQKRKDDDVRTPRSGKRKLPKHKCPKSRGRKFASTVVDPSMKKPPAGVYPTIMEAYKHTQVGGNVYIKPGLYRESLCIEYSVSLRGDTRARSEIKSDRDRVMIEPPANSKGRPQECAVINYPNIYVTLRGLDFRSATGNHSMPCISLRNGHLEMEDSTAQGTLNSAALEMSGGTSHIDRNRFNQSGVGIRIRGSRGEHHIKDNTITDNSIGVEIDGGNHTQLLTNNISYNMSHGLKVAKGALDAAENDLEYNGYAGITIVPERGIRLTENFIANNERYGIHIPFPTDTYMSKNIIGCNAEGGILYTNRIDNAGDMEIFEDNIFEFNPRSKTKKRRWFRRRNKEDVCADYSRDSAGENPAERSDDRDRNRFSRR